ncbi:MAG: DUF4411 family protein [Gammaproteobacteria bacterium]|nr:DUF4411 family protein [Gammaproteobacteria bacterium]MYD77755.1 DUF4411 family protein [Gammaproteobacteria bacterium]MYI89628.1 DUF4411 family protein [Gammaproteobacteria bacterium]
MNAPYYLIDADVFISAKNRYYAFDICPGFWNSLIYHGSTGIVHSIDRVKSELLAGRESEDLVQWVKTDLPAEFFLDTYADDVIATYEKVMLWVYRHPQYYDSAKAKFATEADGWLVAYAASRNAVIITNEQPRPTSRSRILLPDVCAQFNVTYEDTFHLLRLLRIRFEWTAPY